MRQSPAGFLCSQPFYELGKKFVETPVQTAMRCNTTIHCETIIERLKTGKNSKTYFLLKKHAFLLGSYCFLPLSQNRYCKSVFRPLMLSEVDTDLCCEILKAMFYLNMDLRRKNIYDQVIIRFCYVFCCISIVFIKFMLIGFDRRSIVRQFNMSF